MKTISHPLPHHPLRSLCAAVCGALIFTSMAQSAVVVDLTAFNDDIEGSVTGPFADLVTGVSASFTTTIITNTAGVSGPGNFLDFDGGAKGINTVSISGQASWTFTLNADSQFIGVDWSGIDAAEIAGIQSNAWIGATITPGSAAVTFNSVTGTFLFDGSLPGDRFTQANMYGTSGIPIISAGTGVRVFSPNGDAFALGADFTLNLVPEPSSLVLVGIAGVMLAVRRRRDC